MGFWTIALGIDNSGGTASTGGPYTIDAQQIFVRGSQAQQAFTPGSQAQEVKVT